MALLWCDGFDHYGLDENNLTDGVYAGVGSSALSTTPTPPTGTHCIRVSGSNFDGDALRKVLPASTTKLGAAARFYMAGLPGGNFKTRIFSFMTNSALRSQISFVVNSSGGIAVWRGSYYFTLNGENGTKIAESDPILVSNAWNHVEVQAYHHDTDGWVRIAVNGVHVFEATGLDTAYDSSGFCSIAHMDDYSGNVGGTTFYMDDYYAYDFVGDSAVDTDFVPTTNEAGKATNYIGELQVMLLPPNGDTAETDWVRISGSNDFEMINETTPDDATYIYSTADTDLSEFEMTDLPEDITYVRGLQLIGRMSKPDAGACMIRYGMNSDGTVEDNPEFPITMEPTYWWSFMNQDPDSGARWTRASLNAALFRLRRTV